MSRFPIAISEYIEARSQTPMMTPKNTRTRATFVRSEARKMHMKAPGRIVSKKIVSNSKVRRWPKPRLTVPDPEKGSERLVLCSGGVGRSRFTGEGCGNIESRSQDGAVAEDPSVSRFPLCFCLLGDSSPQVEP